MTASIKRYVLQLLNRADTEAHNLTPLWLSSLPSAPLTTKNGEDSTANIEFT
jgi:hypothetical protein